VKKHILLLLLLPLFIHAQYEFRNNGCAVYVQQSGLIHVQGNFVNSSSSDSTGTINNDGIIEVTGNFENDSTAKFKVSTNANSTDRAVKFVGSGTQTISGSMSAAGSSSFYNLVIDKVNPTDVVLMQTPSVVEGSVVFGSSNTTTTYNPSSTYTNNNQLGLLQTFSDTAHEYLLDLQNGDADAIAGYPVLVSGGLPQTGYIMTSGARGSSNGGLQRKIASATSYVFPVGTSDKGFNGIRLNFSEIPGNGSVKTKFCSGSSNPTGYVGGLSEFCSGCTSSNPMPTNNGYNRYFPSNACNGGAPQWLVLTNTAQNHGYWSFASTNTGYSYDLEVFPNSIYVQDVSQSYRVLKHEAAYGADPSVSTVDWRPEIDSLVSNTTDLLTYTSNMGCYSGNGIPGGIYKDFSHFTIGSGGSGGALPVTLLYVKAEAVGKHHITVSWATALEINNHGFEVMRGTDGVNFTDVGWVNGHDNSTVTNTYSFDDRPSQSTTYYYQLKQVDNNGNFVFSNIVSASLSDQPSSFQVYPNPTANDVYLQVEDPAEEVKVVMYDINGQPVYNNIFTIEQTGTSQTLTINASKLMPPGTYILSATTNGQQYSSKIVLQ